MRRQSIVSPIVLIVCWAIAVRLLLWSQPLHAIANDEHEYVPVAYDLLAGRGWQFYDRWPWLRAPLYSLFLAASLWLTGGDLHWAALPNIGLSAATVYLHYLLTKLLMGQRAALIAAAVTATLWTFATFASLYMAETLFTFLFTATLLCLTYAISASSPLQRSAHALHSGRLWWIVLGGICFGLATLTRSLLLLFLPIATLWLFVWAIRHTPVHAPRRLWQILLGPCLFVCCACAVIAPWTIRNYRAYGHPIIVETGLSFNLWFFSEPHESEATIHQTLEGIRNPAERSAYATAKGLARLREDPAILLRKVPYNWTQLWRMKPIIEDRFLKESYDADVSLPLLLALLVFDDLLYVILTLAAIAGLSHACVHALSRGGLTTRAAVTWLSVAWLGYALLTMLLTHTEPRYRHFLFPVLIPYAAWVLHRMRRWRLLIRPHPLAIARWLVIGGLSMVFISTAWSTYAWSWVHQNLVRSWHTMMGNIAFACGYPDQAVRAYEQALAVHPTPDPWMHLGDVMRSRGDLPRAIAAYQEATRLAPSYLTPRVRLGDAQRSIGEFEAARETFRGRYLDEQQVVRWAWRKLAPAPTQAIDVGNGLDFGYLNGVYPAEVQQGATARWTTGHSQMRLGVPLHQGLTRPSGAHLKLKLAAPHPNILAVPARICITQRCWQFTIGPTWRTYQIALGIIPPEPLLIELWSETFQASDGRHLGTLIDSVELLPWGYP